jgi:O-antigen/teichoic acid export membrane protein
MFMFKGDAGATMAAVYNLGLRLMEIIEIPLRSFVATAMPAMAAAYNKGEKGYVVYLMEKYAGMLTFALIPVCLCGVLLADVAVFIIDKKMVGTESANILRLFLTFALLFPADRFLGLGLDVIHKPNINFIKILVMLAANVAGDFAGLLIFGNIYGLAITTIFPTLIGVFVGYWNLRKYHPFRLRDIYIVGFREGKQFLRGVLRPGSKLSL